MRKFFFFGIALLQLGSSLVWATTQNNPYQLYKFNFKHSFIALSPLPGRVDLEQDLKTIKDNNISQVLTLVSDEELIHYKVPNLLDRYQQLNLEYFHSPIVDYGLPQKEQMQNILNWLRKKIKAKENILIHCVGGQGRSGTVMAVYAKTYLGKSGAEAIAFVRSIRGSGAVETKEQEDFVINWE